MSSNSAETGVPVPTERFKRVLAFASDEADGLGHGFVTCQHILYALSRESRGLAHAALESLSLTPERLHSLLADSGAYHDRVSAGGVDLADEVQMAIETAVAIARKSGHRLLDTEHLLAALIANHTSADEMLNALGVKADQVQEALERLHDLSPPVEIREEAVHAYRFTLESAWVLSMAADCARQKGVTVVSSSHLFSGLLRQYAALRDSLFDRFGVTKEHILARLPESGSILSGNQRVTLSRDVQTILGYAIGEAWNRGHQAVTPAHLSLAYVEHRHEGLDLLADLGVSQAEFRDVVERLLSPPITPG
nr:hypothetical protein [Anaerolineae bacterium]